MSDQKIKRTYTKIVKKENKSKNLLFSLSLNSINFSGSGSFLGTSMTKSLKDSKTE